MCECKPAIEGKKIKTIEYAKGERQNPVYADECIAEFIETLNRYGIKTLGSCCGHNKAEGSILISLENVRLFNIDETMRCEILFNPKGNSEIK